MTYQTLSRYAVVYLCKYKNELDDFVCHAEDQEHAVEMFRKFYPEELIACVEYLGEIF